MEQFIDYENLKESIFDLWQSCELGETSDAEAQGKCLIRL